MPFTLFCPVLLCLLDRDAPIQCVHIHGCLRISPARRSLIASSASSHQIKTYVSCYPQPGLIIWWRPFDLTSPCRTDADSSQCDTTLGLARRRR
ncbi:hypothetical protein V8E55_009693 [Tylopilus felleus]